jgi:hypothetical protein
MEGCVVSLDRTKTNTNPVNRRLQGIGSGVGAVWGGRRHCFGDLAVWWTWEVRRTTRLHENRKNPVNRSLQGIGGSMGVVWGGRRRQFGDLAVWWTC